MFYKDDPQAMIWQDREAFNERYIRKLSIDEAVTLNSVLDYLGSPDLTYAKRNKDQVWQIVFYGSIQKTRFETPGKIDEIHNIGGKWIFKSDVNADIASFIAHAHAVTGKWNTRVP